MLVLLVVTSKISAVKPGTSIYLAGLPCLPTCLVCAHYLHSCFAEVDFCAN
jgi:hypothetical protein